MVVNKQKRYMRFFYCLIVLLTLVFSCFSLNCTCLKKPTDEIRNRCKDFTMNKDKIQEFMRRLLCNIERGLQRQTHEAATVKSFVTYAQDLPNGKEHGKFMALDLGGTNLRILLVDLGPNKFDTKSKKIAIPRYIKIGTGEQLFDYIANFMAVFMEEEKVIKEHLPLGFTFSFPLQQLGLTKGVLVGWTKGFNCTGVVSHDVVQLLKEAIDRRGDMHVSILAILNDTTGTLMACARKKHNCKIGTIIGTGYNACYVEEQNNAELFDDNDNGSHHVVINTEFGAFGDDGHLDFIRTAHDHNLDSISINPGRQLQEKMVGGMYMGELLRIALVQFTKDGLLFGGEGSELLSTRGRFYSKYMSEIEGEPTGVFIGCMEVLTELGLKHGTEQDCANVRYVSECVSRRAATIVSAGMATLVNKINDTDVTIGVDGSVYKYHPYFQELMQEIIREYTNPHINFELMLSDDGSGHGAALMAAVASRE